MNAGFVTFAEVDVDKSGDISRQQNISSFPTFLLFQDGKQVSYIIL